MPEAPAGRRVRRGSLTVVGTGIDAVSQLTPAARGAIEDADEVFYLLADPVAARRVESLNPRASSLDHLYGPTKPRRDTYAEVVETIVQAVLADVRVCAVLYGHPGAFALSGHEAMERVRAAGLPADQLFDRHALQDGHTGAVVGIEIEIPLAGKRGANIGDPKMIQQNGEIIVEAI